MIFIILFLEGVNDSQKIQAVVEKIHKCFSHICITPTSVPLDISNTYVGKMLKLRLDLISRKSTKTLAPFAKATKR